MEINIKFKADISTSVEDKKLESVFKSDIAPVVIFPVSHPVAFSVIRAFEGTDVPILALDFKPRSAGLYSNKVKSLLIENMYENESIFIDYMMKIGGKFVIKPVLFLVDDEDLFLSLKEKEKFSEFYNLPSSDWSIVKNIVDKGELYKSLQDENLPCPKTWFISDLNSLNIQKDDITFPCIVKPTYSTRFRIEFGVKAKKFIDFDSLKSFVEVTIKKNINVIVQEYIEGDAKELFTYATYSNKVGDVIGAMTGRKVHQFPPDFGTCRLGETITYPELDSIGRKIIKHFEYYGIALAEYKRTKDGELKLIEINTRPGDWPERLSQIGGANIVKMAYDSVFNKKITQYTVQQSGLKWANISEDFYYSVRGYKILGYKDAHIGFFKWFKDIVGLKTGAFFDITDPLPSFIRFVDMLKEFYKRELTIKDIDR
jgi:predicted ATP-grasp superfamily ATP-dependent carboligase